MGGELGRRGPRPSSGWEEDLEPHRRAYYGRGGRPIPQHQPGEGKRSEKVHESTLHGID